MRHLSIAISLFLLLAGNAVMAQEIAVDVARSNALQFLSSKTSGTWHAKGQPASTDLQLAYTSKSEAKTCFYVFNIGDDEGFVIAGGDEAALEILGYCDHGSFDYDTAPDNFRWWLDQYTEQIAHAEAPSDEALAAMAAHRAKAAQARANIAPLVQTKWGQDYPYNSEIPIYDSDEKRYVTGCVATAMAQVMYYHRCPETTGTGSNEYKSNKHIFSADFGSTTYDWDHMLASYSDDYTDEEAKAVGTLMYHAGVSVFMDYGTSASGAASEDIGPAFVKFYGFDRSVRNEYRIYYSDEDWEDLVYNELAAKRPVLYSGSSSKYGGGHQFICDGYDSEKEMFCFNWGWNGYCDGIYPLTGRGALKPNGNCIGGAGNGADYTTGQMILVNVMKDKGGVESCHLGLPLNLFSDDPIYMMVGNKTYEDNYIYDKEMGAVKLMLLYAVTNMSCIAGNISFFADAPKTYFDFGVKVVERGYDNIDYLTVKTRQELNRESGGISWSNMRFDYDLSQFEYNGVYELHPVFRITGTDEWFEIDVPVSETIPTVTITGAKNRDFAEVNFSVNSTDLYVGETLQINHDSNYQGKITYSSSNVNVATVDDQGVIKGISEGKAVITVKGEADTERLYLPTEKTFEINVSIFVKSDVTFTLNKTTVDTDGQITIKWPSAYDGEVSFVSSNPEIATVDEKGKITGKVEGTVEITAKATETDNYNACETTFSVEVLYLKISFVEEPYFNNDNNVYEDDMSLFYKIKSECHVTRDIELKTRLEIEHAASFRSATFSKAQPGSIHSGSIDYCSVLEFLEFSGSQPKANKQYTVKLLMGNDQPMEDYPALTFTYRNKLTVDYSVGSTGYGTLILPFNAKLPDGMKVYSCPEVDANGVLNLQEEGSIARNKPYIVKATPGDYTFEGPEAIDADKPSFQEGILVGAVTSNVPLQKGTDYILQEQDGKAAFFKFSGTKSEVESENDADGNRLAKQFRAFLRLDGSGHAPKINLPGFSGDEETGIREITTPSNPSNLSNSSNPLIYTPDGHRHSSFQKGLNILILDDGTVQKVFVK